MTLKRLFVLNGVVAGGYGLALLLATDPILDVYGITPQPRGRLGRAGSGWACSRSA